MSCHLLTPGSICWATVTRLSLPLPLVLPIANILIILIAQLPLLIPVLRRLPTRVQNGVWVFLGPYAWYLMSLTPVTVLILAAVYGSRSDMAQCGMASQWSRMFQRKDASAIRAIQDGLRCCGFNSLHDRAWPFPSRGVDAAACERTQGYTNPCADLWQGQESTVAALTILASVLNWILLVSRIW